MSNLASLFDRYKALVIFDTETSGLNPGDDQIIELAALSVERTQAGALRIAGKMDTFIRLPEGERLPENIVTLTGITDRLLETEGVQSGTAVSRFLKLVKPGPVLMVAHNAQFDACFLRELLRGFKPGHLDWLDSLTVYKDRRPYPHKLANAILAYELEDKVQNSHRAIDDVLALFEVLKAMDEERDDLGSYVNLFGYNPKYGVSGRRITGVRYEPQLRERVEEHLGHWIPDSLWERSEPYARRKLDLCRERSPEIDYYNDEYLVLLTADTVRETAFSDFTIAACEALMTARGQ